jgi:hypothetical protein
MKMLNGKTGRYFLIPMGPNKFKAFELKEVKNLAAMARDCGIDTKRRNTNSAMRHLLMDVKDDHQR